MYDQVRRGSKHRTRRRGAAGREAGHGAGHEAGHEDIPWTREGGEGGMREEGRSSCPGRSQARSNQPPRRPTRSQARSNRPPRRMSPAPIGSYTGANRHVVQKVSACFRSLSGPRPGPNRTGRSLARSTGPHAGRVRVSLDQIRSGSLFNVSFRLLVVLNPYISAQDAPKIGLDHV